MYLKFWDLYLKLNVVNQNVALRGSLQETFLFKAPENFGQ